MRTDVFQKTSLGDDVSNVRYVVQRDRFGCENCRGHTRQGGILGAADRHATCDWVAAANAKLFHGEKISGKASVAKGRSLCSSVFALCLCGEFFVRLIHHRDTEDMEICRD